MTDSGTRGPAEAPREILDLADRLMRMLLTGDDPICAVLREQYAHAEIRRVEQTGVGFSVEFAVLADAPRTEPLDMQGGHATMHLDGVKHGAGCVLHVRGGVLTLLEGYTYDEPWPEPLRVRALTDVTAPRPRHRGD